MSVFQCERRLSELVIENPLVRACDDERDSLAFYHASSLFLSRPFLFSRLYSSFRGRRRTRERASRARKFGNNSSVYQCAAEASVFPRASTAKILIYDGGNERKRKREGGERERKGARERERESSRARPFVSRISAHFPRNSSIPAVTGWLRPRPVGEQGRKQNVTSPPFSRRFYCCHRRRLRLSRILIARFTRSRYAV